MQIASHIPLAVLGQPLFGNQWLALAAMLGLVAIFVCGVAVLGRILAATHPEPPATKATATSPSVEVDLATAAPSPELLAVISASVAATFGKRAHVVAVQTLHAPSVEALMLQWSLEGRRQIYTSHKVR